MVFNFNKFLKNNVKSSKIGDFQDLDHLNGVAISTISANLYNKLRDDLVLFYFRDGASHTSVYTQSKIISENIKWNLKIKSKKIKAILINTRNANAFTGVKGYNSLKTLAEELSRLLTEKNKIDDEIPKKIKSSEILFGCTGTIGEEFPLNKIKFSLPSLLENIKYTQNKYIWMKAATGILTTDTKPKVAMEECKIGSSDIKIYGIAKGSGMIYPNMATTLGYIFTDATLSTSILKKVLKKNIETTFNAISCDGDTSTNDMVTLVATNKVKNPNPKNINDLKLKDFSKSLNNVLTNLAKRIASDGEGCSKFLIINVSNCKKEIHAKKIAFSVANSPLVKTAIAGEDPNWGRIIMAIGKANININQKKLAIRLGKNPIIEKGEICPNYSEDLVAEYMKNEKIEIFIEIGTGAKKFTVYSMDLTKKYIEINSDYRS